MTVAPFQRTPEDVTFRRRAPAILVSSTIVVIVAMTYFFHELTDFMVEASEASSFKLMRDVLGSTMKATNEKALVRAELISSMPAVRKAFAARDRAALLSECKDMFAEQKDKYGMEQGQFHLQPATSFLRLHAPDKFGDDQSNRPMLVDVNKNKVHRKGVVLGASGVAVTSIVPMEGDDDKQNGSFEMGLELGPMLDEIKQVYGMEASVYVDEKMLREVATELRGDVLSERNRVGKYVRFYSTHSELSRQLVKDGDIEVTAARSYDRVANGTPWGVQLMPLYDYANKQIGVVALAKDFSEVTVMEARARIWQMLGALFAIVILTGMILVVIRGALLRPLASLSERIALLAAGDASQPAEPSASYCDELRALANSYERLREARKP